MPNQLAPRSIILYYKALVCPGGAERLLVKEYEHLVAMNYDVFLVTNRLNKKALFGTNIPESSLIVLDSSGLYSILKLAYFVSRISNSFVICSSGHIDIFLASIIAGFKYALHIHHPCFMSYNDYDKYSVFLKRWFSKYIQSNFGASKFIGIRQTLTLRQHFLLNIKAILSILSKRRSKSNFVLSNYAKQEKLDLYNINSEVFCGALDDNYTIEAPSEKASTRYTITTVARLDINKRLDVLIKAISLVCHANYDVELQIVGDGPLR